MASILFLPILPVSLNVKLRQDLILIFHHFLKRMAPMAGNIFQSFSQATKLPSLRLWLVMFARVNSEGG